MIKLRFSEKAANIWRNLPHRFDTTYYQAKRKQTKRVLRKMYYSPQSSPHSKDIISLEVEVETKLSKIQLLEILCNSGYKTKYEKNPLFSWSSMPLEIKLPKEWTGKTIYLDFSSIFGDFFLKFFEEEVSAYLSWPVSYVSYVWAHNYAQNFHQGDCMQSSSKVVDFKFS